MYHSPFKDSPPAYGAPPPINLLTSLSGQWIPVIRVQEIKNCFPKRFGLWTSFQYLEDVTASEIFKWRLRFQIYYNDNSHEYHLVKMRSCSISNSDKDDEDIYIEVEVNERKDKHGRLTDEEVAYIRSLDEK